jgi:DNA-binding beta-propeller fold protein YncE
MDGLATGSVYARFVKNATVIDPVKETVVKVIDMGGGPEYPVADGQGTIYDDNEEKNDVVAINTATLKIEARWPVAPAGAPVGMAIDIEHRRIFSAGRKPQILVMMDANNGKVLQSLPIGAGVDANIFEPETGLLFISTRAGKIPVFHEDSPDKLTEVETVTTEFGAKTMNIDSKTHNLFLTTADFAPVHARQRRIPSRLENQSPKRSACWCTDANALRSATQARHSSTLSSLHRAVIQVETGGGRLTSAYPCEWRTMYILGTIGGFSSA